jgi:methionyl aminopeptidase
MIPIKTCQEIDKMRKAGRVLATVMDEIRGLVKPGVLTKDLDKAALRAMSRFKVRPAFKNFNGYPANICVSVNEEVVHGIPGPRCLVAGDIVSVDIGIESEGFFADMAETFPVGKVDDQKDGLMTATRASLIAAIKFMKVGNRLSDVSCAVQEYVEARGFSVVRNFVGHGIGRELHEEPQIPNFGRPHTGPYLEAGMVFALEPMINIGTWEVEILEDGWTAVTKDRLPSAHFEHTVAIGKEGPEILTKADL